MRDYRGNRLDNGEWVYGFYTKSPSGNHYITETVCGGASPKKVHPNTVGQYTGIYTTEETEDGDTLVTAIYEGDIVDAVLTDGIHEDFSWGRHVVVFDRGAFCLKDRRGLTTPMCSYAANVKFKVLGNVWDNQELMEGHGNAKT